MQYYDSYFHFFVVYQGWHVWGPIFYLGPLLIDAVLASQLTMIWSVFDPRVHTSKNIFRMLATLVFFEAIAFNLISTPNILPEGTSVYGLLKYEIPFTLEYFNDTTWKLENIWSVWPSVLAIISVWFDPNNVFSMLAFTEAINGFLMAVVTSGLATVNNFMK